MNFYEISHKREHHLVLLNEKNIFIGKHSRRNTAVDHGGIIFTILLCLHYLFTQINRTNAKMNENSRYENAHVIYVLVRYLINI